MSEIEDELVSLEAIYGADYVPESPLSFLVKIQPSLGGSHDTVFVSCNLSVVYPAEGYPTKPAGLALKDVIGLSPSQLSELEGIVGATAIELLGSPCVYSVVEAVREWLTNHNIKPSDGSAFDEMMRAKKARETPILQQGALSRENDPSIKKTGVSSSMEEDEVVRRKRDGTPVNPETFLKWRAAFEVEIAKAKEEEEASAKKS